jgi:hypothetical protein
MYKSLFKSAPGFTMESNTGEMDANVTPNRRKADETGNPKPKK